MKLTLPLAVVPVVLCLAQGSAILPAQAQLMRTFVSAAVGNDANDCNRGTPCRSFQGAHDKTLDQGEITVLDPGGYGAVTITKSISIVNDGVGEASILVSGGTAGVTINGGAVSLRGITVQGIGFGGGPGLRFNSGSSLTIANCVFRNHAQYGIFFALNTSGTANLSISNTLVADNAFQGIQIQPIGTADINLHVAVDRVRSVNNGFAGMSISGGAVRGTGAITATITDSVSANNGGDGFIATTPLEPTMTTAVTLARSVAAHNRANGLEVNAFNTPNVSLRVGGSTIVGNAQTWARNGAGVLQTFGDNYIAGNADGDPALPVIASK